MTIAIASASVCVPTAEFTPVCVCCSARAHRGVGPGRGVELGGKPTVRGRWSNEPNQPRDGYVERPRMERDVIGDGNCDRPFSVEPK